MTKRAASYLPSAYRNPRRGKTLTVLEAVLNKPLVIQKIALMLASEKKICPALVLQICLID